MLFEDDEHGPTPAFKKSFDPVCDELDAFEAGAEVAAVAAVVMLESGKVLALTCLLLTSVQRQEATRSCLVPRILCLF